MATEFPCRRQHPMVEWDLMSRTLPHNIKPSRPLTAEALAGDLVQPGHALFGIVWVNPQRMSGVPCFAGTRVPIKTLFDYLEGGESLDEFLGGFEGVMREQAVAVLDLA